MKKLLFLLLPLFSFGQGANKSKLDSVVWLNQTLYSYVGSIPSYRGGLLDSRGNLVIRNNVSTGVRNTLLGYHNSAGGTGNTITGNNGVIDAGVIGATLSGADGAVHAGGDYADVGNDANEAWGESSFTRGFGNDNYSTYGAVFGNDNYMGYGWSSFMSAQRSTTFGNLSFTVGRVVQSYGDNNYTFGTGKDNTLDSLESEVPNSFNVGFNKEWRFRVLPDNVIQINGIDYKFPTTTPSVGSVLTYKGNGVVEWDAPPAIAKPAPALSEQPKPGKYMVMTTSGQLLYLIQIK